MLLTVGMGVRRSGRGLGYSSVVPAIGRESPPCPNGRASWSKVRLQGTEQLLATWDPGDAEQLVAAARNYQRGGRRAHPQ